MIDIGANLTHKRFDQDRAATIERAYEAGIDVIVVTGTSLAASQKALKIAQQHGLLCTAGIHPHEARTFNQEARNTLTQLFKHPEVVAVGECGLDFDRNFSTPESQKACFIAHLEMATETRLPMFLHERAAHTDFTDLLRAYEQDLPQRVVHCFTGNKDELKKYLDLNCWIGVTGWITDSRRSSALKEALKYIPQDRLMIETDAPFLLPKNLPFKTDRNEPAFLPYVVQGIASVLGKPATEVAHSTSRNAEAFFELEWA